MDFEFWIIYSRRAGLSCLPFLPLEVAYYKKKDSNQQEAGSVDPYYSWNVPHGGILSLGWILRTFIGKPSQKTLNVPPDSSLCAGSLITTQHYTGISSFPSILLPTWPQFITPFSGLFDYTFKFTCEQRNQCTWPDSPKMFQTGTSLILCVKIRIHRA